MSIVRADFLKIFRLIFSSDLGDLPVQRFSFFLGLKDFTRGLDERANLLFNEIFLIQTWRQIWVRQ